MSDTALRSKFPFFTRHQRASADVYLDSAATSQKPASVIEALTAFYVENNANVHRSSHDLAQASTEAFELARESVCRFINARDKSEIIWTKGTTESINLVAAVLAQGELKPGQRILLSTTEHHANIVPWQMLAQRLGLSIDVIPVDERGVWQLDAALALIVPQTALVAVAQVSNALGTINPLQPVLARAREVGALTLVDGAQAVAHMTVDVQALNCDFYAFSGHKMYGPTGIGVLYGKRSLLERLPPYQFGGEMIERVSFSGTRFQPPPLKFEAGTPNVAGVRGLKAAVDFIVSHREAIVAQEENLSRAMERAIAGIDGVLLLGDAQARIGTYSFCIDGVDNQDVGILLNQKGFAVRVGHHCAMPLMQALGIDGTIRVSLACYNTLDEISRFADALRQVLDHLCGEEDDTLAPGPGPSVAQPGMLADSILAARGWDETYRQIMLAGKSLDKLAPAQRTDEHAVHGCESQVWLKSAVIRGKVHIQADSPSKIVRGLLAILIEPLQGQTPQWIKGFDHKQYLAQLGLSRHLSESRGNGLAAVMQRIRQEVQN